MRARIPLATILLAGLAAAGAITQDPPYVRPDAVVDLMTADGARLVVDRKSFLYLKGTELDYKEELMASGFNLRNPNVKRSCGCGSSFVV